MGERTVFNAALTRIGVAIASIPHRIVREDRGATAVEYGLIVGLIAVVIIGAVAILGQTLGGWFTQINTEITDATTP